MARLKFVDELRPCLINEKIKALFHGWYTVSDIVGPSLMVGGHNGGIIVDVIGIVEYENGTIHPVLPEQIKFVDDKFQDYSFDFAVEKQRIKEES